MEAAAAAAQRHLGDGRGKKVQEGGENQRRKQRDGGVKTLRGGRVYDRVLVDVILKRPPPPPGSWRV